MKVLILLFVCSNNSYSTKSGLDNWSCDEEEMFYNKSVDFCLLPVPDGVWGYWLF